jgi:hypothetical protein
LDIGRPPSFVYGWVRKPAEILKKIFGGAFVEISGSAY